MECYFSFLEPKKEDDIPFSFRERNLIESALTGSEGAFRGMVPDSAAYITVTIGKEAAYTLPGIGVGTIPGRTGNIRLFVDPAYIQDPAFSENVERIGLRALIKNERELRGHATRTLGDALVLEGLCTCAERAIGLADCAYSSFGRNDNRNAFLAQVAAHIGDHLRKDEKNEDFNKWFGPRSDQAPYGGCKLGTEIAMSYMDNFALSINKALLCPQGKILDFWKQKMGVSFWRDVNSTVAKEVGNKGYIPVSQRGGAGNAKKPSADLNLGYTPPSKAKND